MAGEWLLVTQFTAAALMLALAAWLCWLDFASRAARAFAAFLLLRAGIILATRFADLGFADTTVFSATLVYYNIALLAAVAYFLSVYPRPRGPVSTKRGFVGLVVLVIAAEVTYALDHCLVVCAGIDGPSYGPLGPLASSIAVATAVGGFLLIRDATRRAPGHDEVSLFLLGAAFTVNGGIDGATFVGALLVDASRLGSIPIGVLALPLVALAVAVLAVAASWKGRKASALRLAFFAGLVWALGIASGAGWGQAGDTGLATATIGVARLAIPLLAGYALLRHRLFDIDLRARTLLNKATIGAFFAAVFFVVSEGTADYLGSQMGTYVGIVVAGGLLFVLAPLERLASRLVDVATGASAPRSHDECLVIYRDMMTRAWANGSLSKEERLFLEQLRQRLGLSPEDAARIETEALSPTPSADRIEVSP